MIFKLFHDVDLMKWIQYNQRDAITIPVFENFYLLPQSKMFISASLAVLDTMIRNPITLSFLVACWQHQKCLE